MREDGWPERPHVRAEFGARKQAWFGEFDANSPNSHMAEFGRPNYTCETRCRIRGRFRGRFRKNEFGPKPKINFTRNLAPVVIITCPARACIRGSAADLPASGSIRDAQVTAQSRRFWICSRTPDVDRCRRQTGMRKRLDKVPCCSCRTEHREPALRSACSACIVCTHSTRCGDCESRLQPDCARTCGLTDSNISGVGGRSE